MRNEQYSLIEEESRHIDPLDDDSMVSLAAGDYDHEEDPEQDEQTVLAGNLSSTTSLDQTAQNLHHLVGTSAPDDALEQLQSMNLEFENLLLAFQRGVGKLCRSTLLKSHDYLPSTSTHPDHPHLHQSHLDSGLGLEGSQDLDTLTLLECRLDEWIT
jgi:hypothetical protein